MNGAAFALEAAVKFLMQIIRTWSGSRSDKRSKNMQQAKCTP
jgi:hypothetical protein